MNNCFLSWAGRRENYRARSLLPVNFYFDLAQAVLHAFLVAFGGGAPPGAMIRACAAIAAATCQDLRSQKHADNDDDQGPFHFFTSFLYGQRVQPPANQDKRALLQIEFLFTPHQSSLSLSSFILLSMFFFSIYIIPYFLFFFKFQFFDFLSGFSENSFLFPSLLYHISFFLSNSIFLIFPNKFSSFLSTLYHIFS